MKAKLWCPPRQQAGSLSGGHKQGFKHQKREFGKTNSMPKVKRHDL
jgi:hypothetical protein